MRALPIADYYPHNPKGYDIIPSPVAYTKELVLSIQKQAYEDGLRDAEWKARAEQLLSVPIPDDAPAASGSFRQVLTASQKEPQ